MEHTHEEYKELTLKVIDNIAKALNTIKIFINFLQTNIINTKS